MRLLTTAIACATAIIATSLAAAAQGPYPRLVQIQDGTLYLLRDGMAHVIAPAPIADAELAAYLAGETYSDGQVRPSQARPRVEDFEILSFRWEIDRTGSVRYVGELRNNGQVAAGVELQIIARDASGILIASNDPWPASVRNIAAGERWPIRGSISNAGSTSEVSVRAVDVRVWN